MKAKPCTKAVLGLSVALGLLTPAVGKAASTVTFDNQSGKPALVKLVGPTASSVAVENSKKERVSVASGHYFIKVRYGTAGAYSYSKGDEFDVTETATAASRITITLHKVVAGNYGSKPISESEFSGNDSGGKAHAEHGREKDSAPSRSRGETLVPTEQESKVLEALMACGYARPHGVSVSAPDFGDLVKITAIASAEFGTNPIHRAVWHTLERASATNVEVHLMALTSEHPKVETIQAVLGSEDSKREGNIGKQGAPEPLGEAAAEPLGEVTWYLYGWSEFAVQQGKVVAVRVSGRAFRRAPERAYSDQELERTRKRLEERRRNEDRSDN